MRLGLRRLLTTMSAMENKGPSMLASPKTQDPLFRRIEDVHEDLRKPYGRILDAGTGGHSLKWLATLPTDAVCLLYTSPSPRDQRGSRMPSSA